MAPFSKVRSALADISRFALDLIFPPVCAACGKHSPRSASLCTACAERLIPHATLFCAVCRARLPYAKKICHRDAPYILGAAGDYQNEVIRNLIHALKFNGVRSAAEPLGEFLARYAASLNFSLAEFTIVPVPLSRERERARGFNQSLLIAEVMGSRLSLPVAQNAIAKIRNAPPQSEARDREMRRENVRGCFAVPDPAVLPKRILLIDDVATSGATLAEAARCLKGAGAQKIIALVAAKA